MAKEIVLSNGMIALVSDEDYERVAQYKWTATPSNQYKRHSGKTKWYAARWESIPGKFKTIKSGPNRGKKRPAQLKIYLHRWLCDAPPGFVVDHYPDNNGLNCQRHNMVIATHQENATTRGNIDETIF